MYIHRAWRQHQNALYCTGQGQGRWPGISSKKHCSMSAIPVNICLQTTQVHTNRNAPCDYRHTGNSGRQKVTLELSWIFRELLIALHVSLQRQPNGVGLETRCSDGPATCWVAEKQSHSEEKKWMGFWPSAVRRGAFYYPTAAKPVCRRTDRLICEWLLYTAVYTILISWKFPNNLTARGRDSSGGIATRYGLDGLGIEFLWWGGDLRNCPDRPLGPTQPHVQWVPSLSRGKAALAWCWPPTPI